MMTPKSGIEVTEMVGYKQLHGELWRCKDCCLSDLHFADVNAFIEHAKKEHGYRDCDLTVEGGTVWNRITQQAQIIEALEMRF